MKTNLYHYSLLNCFTNVYSIDVIEQISYIYIYSKVHIFHCVLSCKLYQYRINESTFYPIAICFIHFQFITICRSRITTFVTNELILNILNVDVGHVLYLTFFLKNNENHSRI